MFRLGKFAWNRRAILVATIPALLALVGLLTVAVDEVYGQAVPGGMDAPTLNPGSASIFVTWVAPSENGGSAITGYEMYYKATDGGSIIEGYDGATTLSDSFGATDSSVGSYGTVYEVKVRAKNAQGYGPWSDTSTEKFGSKINFPRKYVVREITENSSGNVGAAVTPNRGGSGTSTVYVLSGSGSNLFNIGSGNGQISIKGSTKIDFESLKPQNNRPVRPGSRGWNLTITATKEFSTNGKDPKRYEASTVVIVVVLDQDGEPDSPSNLTAIPHDAQVTLSWDNAGDDTITEYQYRRSSDGGTTWAPDWEVIPDSDKDTTSFEITELANGTEYTFSVRAINDVGAGASATEISATPNAIPDQPTGLRALAGDEEVTLSWHDPGNSSITKYQYQYVSNEPESMSSDWIDISDSAPGSANASSFTVGSLTNHVTYTFTIRAVNDTGESATSDSAVATPNAEPTFSAGETAVFTVAENTSPGDDIGNPLAATDGDDDALIYILEGSDLEGSDAASFDIVADTGQLKTYDPLDFETKPTYSIIVSVSDLHGGTDSIDVTINVQNVREPPSAPTVSPSATDGHTSLDVQWTAPDTTGLTPVRDYEIQYKVVGPQIWTSHAFTGIDTTTTIGGLSPNTRYEVQIAADNEHGPTGWSESGFGTTNPAPNTTPRVIAPGEDQTLSVGGSPATLDLSSIFSDPDGNPLTYAASSSDAGVVMASTSGSSLTLTPVEAGTATITITATDPSGARVSDQIGVTVSGSATVEEEESPTPEPTAEPTPAPTVAPTLAPSPTPPPAVQEILEVFEESPEQAGELVGQIADDDPEEAGDLIAETALHDLQATGLIVCEAVKGHAGGIGRALGHGAGQDAGTINRALGTVAGDGDCVSQLGGEIPVGPWIPEQPPQEGQDPTGEGEWQDVGSPAPVENVLARFFNPMEGAKTNIVNHEGRPAGTEPLPPDRMPYAFVDIGHENFDNEDVVTAHATISVEKEWLTANQVHQWSVQFSRYNDTTSAWTPTQAKRVNEDDAKVYFTVTVPGFSLWAIHGSTEAPAAVFDEDNLSVAPLAVNAGQLVVVSVDVTNKTVESATYFANLWVDSQIGRTDEVVIGAGQTTTVNVPLIVDAPGSYQIRIGSQILDAPLIVVAPGVEPTVAAPAQVATPTQSAPPTVAATVESTPAPAISPTLPPTLPPTIAPAPTPAPAAALPSLEPLLGEIVFSDPNVAAGDPVVVTIPITYAGTSERTVTIETLAACPRNTVGEWLGV